MPINDKLKEYETLVLDIRQARYEVIFEAVEIGQRGQVDKANKTRLKNILKLCECSSVKFREFTNELSKLALIASFVIFYSRKDKLWDGVQCITL